MLGQGEQEGAALLKRSRLIDVVIGTQQVKQLPMLVTRALDEDIGPQVDINPHEDVSFPLGIARRADAVKAYVNIIEGCNEFCAFCVVPYTRGHERMRPSAEILAEVRDAAAHGHREIQLLGQIVNHYQAPDDAACDFAGLLVVDPSTVFHAATRSFSRDDEREADRGAIARLDAARMSRKG